MLGVPKNFLDRLMARMKSGIKAIRKVENAARAARKKVDQACGNVLAAGS